MRNKLVVCFAIAALAIASAKSFSVTLYQPVRVGSMELKPGEYRIEVKEQKAVFRNGKILGEVPVQVESGDSTFPSNSVRLVGEGTPRIQEIRIGGTKTTLKFSE
jgi:hypothetical protein